MLFVELYYDAITTILLILNKLRFCTSRTQNRRLVDIFFEFEERALPMNEQRPLVVPNELVPSLTRNVRRQSPGQRGPVLWWCCTSHGTSLERPQTILYTILSSCVRVGSICYTRVVISLLSLSFDLFSYGSDFSISVKVNFRKIQRSIPPLLNVDLALSRRTSSVLLFIGTIQK